MSENIPESDNLPHPYSPQVADLSIDNPPEPDNASIRAERGSPTPSSVTVDNVHDRTLPIFDPFSNDTGIPEVPVPSSSALSISSQALSDPTPPLPGSIPVILQGNVKESNKGVSTSSHPLDPQEPNEINIDYLAQLLDLGFDEFTASLALKRTNNIGVEQAVSWIIERSNESDFEDDSSSSETDPEEDRMGAQQSSSNATVTEGAMDLVKQLAKRNRTHKMVLVANMSLKMGVGKLAAQVGHATLGVYRHAMNSEAGSAAINSWTRHGQVKIVVRGQSTEQLMDLCKAAKDAGCFYYLVQDAGYTQIPAGSRTILGVFGTVEQVDSVTGGLKLL